MSKGMRRKVQKPFATESVEKKFLVSTHLFLEMVKQHNARPTLPNYKRLLSIFAQMPNRQAREIEELEVRIKRAPA